MAEIVFDNISRNYKVPVKNGGYLRYLMRREYKVIEAVKGVSFGISHGEAVGMIGPNGAGKSTTMKMMTGILVPSSGKVTVFGKDPFRYRKEICRESNGIFQDYPHFPDCGLCLDLIPHAYSVRRGGANETHHHLCSRSGVVAFQNRTELDCVCAGLPIGSRNNSGILSVKNLVERQMPVCALFKFYNASIHHSYNGSTRLKPIYICKILKQ